MLISEESRDLFFLKRLNKSGFKNSGMETVDREQFKTCRIEGIPVLKMSFRNFTGSISKGQVEGFIFFTISVSVDGDTG